MTTNSGATDGAGVSADASRMVAAGTAVVPDEREHLAAVVASGMVITMFDHQAQRGGLTHFACGRRRRGQSTPWYAAPAIVGLTRLLGITRGQSQVEVHLYGAAEQPDAPGYRAGHRDDVEGTAREVLATLGLAITSEDLGGQRPRKLIFDSQTGECVVARVERVRDSDWYPTSAKDLR